jgi:hypothetical protein
MGNTYIYIYPCIILFSMSNFCVDFFLLPTFGSLFDASKIFSDVC